MLHCQLRIELNFMKYCSRKSVCFVPLLYYCPVILLYIYYLVNLVPYYFCTFITFDSDSCLFLLYSAGYHAPLDIYVELNRISSDPKVHSLPPDKSVNVCVGKEWYRFPSNFFLPGNK